MIPPQQGTGAGAGAWLVLAGVWALSASVSGLVLAFVARRVHPGLSLYRLWAFYSLLCAFLVAVVMAVGIL